MSFDKINDTRVVYTGDDFPDIGIEKGERYGAVISNLATTVNELKTTNTVDASCIGDACDNALPLNEAVEKVLGELCSMSTDNHVSTANMYGIGDSYNPSAAALTNRTMNYSTVLGDNTMTFNYNLGSLANALPSGFSLIGANVIASGVAVNNNTTIAQSTLLTGGFNIPLDRVPATVDVTLRVSSPTGNIDLKRTVSLPAAAPTGGNVGVDLSPSGGGGSTQYTQKQINEMLAAQLSTQQQIIDSLLTQINS